MKITKTMGAAALGLGLAVAAQAQTYTPIYITGSTAFRGQIFQALQNELGLTVQQGGTSGNNSFTFQGAITDSKSQGFPVTGTLVDVYCDFSGSAEGVQTIINNVANNYLNVGTAGSGSFSENGADYAFSDVGQNSTPFTTAITGVTLPEIQTAADAAFLPFTGMAVVPFTFAVNHSGNASGINNISDSNFRDLYRIGKLDESLFTGITPGEAFVYAVGRYNLSGTRITGLLDDYDTTTAPLVQYGLGTNGLAVPGLNQGDGTAPAGYNWISVANSGYFTGGNVGVALNATPGSDPGNAAINATNAAIGYIAWSDAQGKFSGTGAGAVPIKWKGQSAYIGTFGSGNWNISGLENGDYNFFSYERLYENPSDHGVGTPSLKDQIGQDLVLGVQYEITHATPQTADIEGNMNVYRANDGGDVVVYGE